MLKLRYTGKPAEADVNRLFSSWMEELLNEDEKVVYLDADLMRGLNTADLWENVLIEYITVVFKKETWCVLQLACI